MNLTTLKLLGVGWHTAKPGWRLAGQTHPHHELIIILRGAQYVELDGPPFRAAAGARGVPVAGGGVTADPDDAVVGRLPCERGRRG